MNRKGDHNSEDPAQQQLVELHLYDAHLKSILEIKELPSYVFLQSLNLHCNQITRIEGLGMRETHFLVDDCLIQTHWHTCKTSTSAQIASKRSKILVTCIVWFR